MTTLLELQDENGSLTLEGDKDKLSLDFRHIDFYGPKGFELTKEKARLLIESIQSYFKLDA